MRSPKRPRTKRPSTRELTRQADRILAEAAVKTREFEKQGLRSVILPRAELIRKLSGKTARSPFLNGISWGNAVRGSTFPLHFWIINPDPFPYDEANLGLCVYWGPGTGVADLDESLLAADKAVGVLGVNIGTLNTSLSAVPISASHVLPAALAAGGNHSDVSYVLYTVDPWAAGVVLERGSLSVTLT